MNLDPPCFPPVSQNHTSFCLSLIHSFSLHVYVFQSRYVPSYSRILSCRRPGMLPCLTRASAAAPRSSTTADLWRDVEPSFRLLRPCRPPASQKWHETLDYTRFRVFTGNRLSPRRCTVGYRSLLHWVLFLHIDAEKAYVESIPPLKRHDPVIHRVCAAGTNVEKEFSLVP